MRRQDRVARNAKGSMTRLAPEEHLRRAAIYLANRAFDEALEHWQAFINYYPNDSRVAQALLGMGRAYFQPRRYLEAYNAYDQLAREFPLTKEGREGLNFSAASLCASVEPLKQPIVTFNTSIAFRMENELIPRTSMRSTH